jgi:hypothetical protein
MQVRARSGGNGVPAVLSFTTGRLLRHVPPVRRRASRGKQSGKQQLQGESRRTRSGVRIRMASWTWSKTWAWPRHPNGPQSEVVLQQSEELFDEAALFIALALGR